MAHGTYRDALIRVCMPTCTGLQYSDSSTGDCVDVCPWNVDFYGQLENKSCVAVCDKAYEIYADNVTRTCLKICPA